MVDACSKRTSLLSIAITVQFVSFDMQDVVCITNFITKYFLNLIQNQIQPLLEPVNPCDGAKLVSTWEQNILYTQKLADFMLKKDIYGNSLKSVIFACKCLFYRPEHNAQGDLEALKFEVLEMQK